MTRARRAVFLDRDGVLNLPVVVDGKPFPPTPETVQIAPGAAEACAALRDAGWLLIGCTNQPDIARGTRTRAEVDAVNAVIQAECQLDELYVCPHDDPDSCDCRKPLPGMLVRGAAVHGVDLSHSVMVGDRWKDIVAGDAAGCATVFIDRGYDERRPDAPDHTAPSLLAAVPWILERTGPSNG